MLTPRRERTLVTVMAVTLVLLRGAVFVLFDTVHFESDQAMVGLAAKHLSEFRAFPVFLYGQDYLLAVEPWLATPLFWIGGPTVAMLKLPLVALNVAVVLLLLHHLVLDAGLRPSLALVAAAFVVMPPPFAAARLVEASGGNVEPLLWTLLIWNLRSRSLMFGAVFAVAFLNREFTVYGLSALLTIQALDGSLFTREALRRKALAGASFLAVWQSIRMLARVSSVYGPGSTGVPLPPSGSLLDRFCWEPQSVAARLGHVFQDHLSLLFGARATPLADLGINSRTWEGLDGLWPLLGLAACVAIARVLYGAVVTGKRPWHAPFAFSTYLVLVGLQAVVMYAVARCTVGPPTVRYALLGLFLAVGLVAAYLTIERRRRLIAPMVAVVVLWCGVGIASHARLAREYLAQPPIDRHRTLADHLVANDVRVGRADYWDAYEVSFLSRERVVLASTSVTRVLEYLRRADRQPGGTVTIAREVCARGVVVDVPGDALDPRPYFVCPPPNAPRVEPAAAEPGSCNSVPAAPAGLTAAVSGPTVRFTWHTADGCPATSYIVEGGSAPGRGDLAILDTGSPDPVFVAPALEAGTYFVRVWGRNSLGMSEPSNEVMVVVP